MTTMTQAEILALANEIAEVEDDMNEVTQGGGGNFNKKFKPGWTLARFTSYIETGKHVELFQGKAKDPKPMCRLGFHLYSPDYLNDDGTPYFMETMDKPKDRNEKAWTSKTFRAMNYKQQAKGFPQLLNGIFLVEIVDYTPKSGGEARSVIGQITPGLDRLTNVEYACPEAPKLFLFSWSKPTLAAWDALKIEGTNEKTGKSKNWVQEKMAGATDFVGSALEGLLLANGRPIPQGTPQKTAAKPETAAGAAAPTTPAVAPVAAAAAAPVAATAVAAPVTAPVVAAPVVSAPVVAAPVVAAPVVAAPVVAAPLAQ